MRHFNMAKVSELEGALLDYWVARANGMPDHEPGTWTDQWGQQYSPSTNWVHGGLQIVKYRIGIEFYGSYWGADLKDADGCLVPHPDPAAHEKMADGFCPVMATGDTPLVAAMRALVTGKFGDEVGIDSHPEGG